MKRYLTIFVFIVVCFLLQTTLFTSLQIANLVPNLILVVTVSAGLLYGRKAGMFAGVICGLLVDLLYGSVVGVSVLMFTVIGYGCGAASKLYFEDDLIVPLAAIAASDFVYGLQYYALHFLLRGRLHLLFYIRSIILPEMIYTVILGALLFWLLRLIDRKLHPPVEVPLHSKKPFED